MDNLFKYEPNEVVERLASIEPEVYETHYKVEGGLTQDAVNNGRTYIEKIFAFMKKNFNQKECSVLGMIKQLFCIAQTGEYSYLQEFENITYKSEPFECIWGEGDSGKKGVLYACRLLRYYYLVYEKGHNSAEIWEEIEKICSEISSLDFQKPARKKLPTNENEDKGSTSSEAQFMISCYNHMNKYYIGQELLKKKLCATLAQWKFHDVRSVLLMIGPSGCGKNYMMETIDSFPELGMPVIIHDCSGMTPNGFTGGNVSGIYERIAVAMNKYYGDFNSHEKCVVYLDEIDKIINHNHDCNGEDINAAVQQQLLSMIAGTEIVENIDTKNILFILGGAFPRIEDLKKEKRTGPLGFNATRNPVIDIGESIRDQILAIGGEVEFVGRINEIVKLDKPTRGDLKRILMDDNIGAFIKKRNFYRSAGLDLEMEEDMIDAIVDLIVKEDAGARSVGNVMDQFVGKQYYFDMIVEKYTTLKIHRGMLYGEKPILEKGGQHYEKHSMHF